MTNETFLIIKAIKVCTAAIAGPILVLICALSLKKEKRAAGLVYLLIMGFVFTIGIYGHFWMMGL